MMDIPEEEPRPVRKMEFADEIDGLSWWKDEQGNFYPQFEDCRGG